MSDRGLAHHLMIRENKPVAFSAGTLEKIQSLILRYPEGKQKSALLPILHIAQEESGGYLSVDLMDYVASLLDIQPIEVYEVATFYSMFYLHKTGKFVLEVCHTGPCAICGGEEILAYIQERLQIKTGETTPDGLFTLREVECLGACGNAPVMQVNTGFREHLNKEKIDHILDELRARANQEQTPDLKWAKKFC